MKKTLLVLTTIMLLVVGVALSIRTSSAQDDPTPTPSSYAALLETEIRGLSPEQIEGYRTGAGLGMALPAELNGYPGPRHVLDLSDELELTDDQNNEIQALYNDMLPEAIRLGEEILAKEGALEEAFREGSIQDETLETQLSELGVLYSQLRFTHLRTHLSTIDILTPHQVFLYNSIRGYANEMPEGHSGHAGHNN